MGAMNLCIPTTLLRRMSYPMAAVLHDLPNPLRDSLLGENGTNNTSGNSLSILLYDSDSTRGKILSQLCHTLNKFSNVNAQLYVLDGGFLAVPTLIIEYPDQAVNSPNSQTSSTFTSPTGSLTLSSATTTPGSATSLSSLAIPKNSNTSNLLFPPSLSFKALSPVPGPIPVALPLPLFLQRKLPAMNQPNHLGGFTLPAATPSKQKFLTSLKTNLLPKLDMNSIRVNDKSATHELKVPSTLSVEQLPPWLKFAKEMPANEILTLLVNKFSRIERLQQLRLASAISNSSSNISPPHTDHTLCSPSGLCPGCDDVDYKLPQGIEDGLKNRYHNVWPFEHTRVKLRNRVDDYFNANYILDKYIATQNPLVNTFADFWQLVWENNVNCVISLNGNSNNQSDLLFSRRRSESGDGGLSKQYFDDQVLGKFEIKQISKESHGAFSLMQLELSCNDSEEPSRKVYRLEFEQWPDFGVPTDFDSFIQFIEFKNRLLKYTMVDSAARLLVHCSAGCGRTGVFITLDLLIDRYITGDHKVHHSEQDQIYQVIQRQRSQRVNMVQNVDQYFVCYELMLYYISLRGGEATI